MSEPVHVGEGRGQQRQEGLRTMLRTAQRWGKGLEEARSEV